jgi:cupin 2 domain-containing protein
MARAEAFYDPVMAMLGFKKGTRPIAGDPHIHYFNRITQYTIRPARSDRDPDPYAPGSLHHLCFRVATHAEVDDASRRLHALGIEASAPRIYEYRPDYYATFFADPDGTRLEIVADTELRRTLRGRWDELEGFEDPVSRLPAAERQPIAAANVDAEIPGELPDELKEILTSNAQLRVERIVSRGHASPDDFWYDQDEHELVFLYAGAARLEIADQPEVELRSGDWLVLPAGCRHRVAWTSPNEDTIWLAVFYRD